MHCLQRNGVPSEVIRLPFQEINFYHFKCENGHDAYAVLQNHKFEILAEVGVNAILDGYYREAVTSFSASLERFYEHYFKVVSFSESGNFEQVEKAWKSVSAQSERQLGMYLAAHFLKTGKIGPTLSREKAKFRNDVVHKGIIPSREEAIDFAQSVIDIVNPLLWDLRENFKAGYMHLYRDNIIKGRENCEEYDLIATSALQMVYNTLLENNSNVAMCDILKAAEARRKR